MLIINLLGILHYFCAKIQITNKVNRICYVCFLKLDIFNLYTMVINTHVNATWTIVIRKYQTVGTFLKPNRKILD